MTTFLVARSKRIFLPNFQLEKFISANRGITDKIFQMETEHNKRLKSSDECWDEEQFKLAIQMSLQEDAKRKRSDQPEVINLGNNKIGE